MEEPVLRLFGKEAALEKLLQQLTEYLQGILVSGIMDNLTSTFSNLNTKLGDVTNSLAQSPADFQPSVFNMIRSLSENVIMPIAGLLLTFIACYELIQLVMAHNNLANFETWIFFKWVFKTFVAVELITHTFDITMAIFDVAQHVISQSHSGYHNGGRLGPGRYADDIGGHGAGTAVCDLPADLRGAVHF